MPRQASEAEKMAEVEGAPAYTFPKVLGNCVDKLYRLRQERLAAQKAVDAIGAEETALRDHIIANFGKTEIEGAKGKVASCGITRKTVGQVKDWEKFYTYIKRTSSFDLLERRVNNKAYNDRLEAKQPVPGVEPFQVVGLSITKVR
jgi:hypothetical protein